MKDVKNAEVEDDSDLVEKMFSKKAKYMRSVYSNEKTGHGNVFLTTVLKCSNYPYTGEKVGWNKQNITSLNFYTK